MKYDRCLGLVHGCEGIKTFEIGFADVVAMGYPEVTLTAVGALAFR
jgi:hypothetical protein